MSLIGQCLKYSNHEVSYQIYKFYQKRNFGGIEIDSNVSLISPETSVELLEVSVDFSERNASVAKTRSFELLCSDFLITFIDAFQTIASLLCLIS
jgi:hypothetical protein